MLTRSGDADLRSAAEEWFLRRGLPAVLRPGTLVRGVWSRSAPALAAFAVSMAFSIVIVAVTGKHTIDIDGTPTRTEWFVLLIVVLVAPAAVTVGRLVSRVDLRLIMATGFGLTALALWQMTHITLQMDSHLIIVSGFIQGVGIGFTFVPLSAAAFATLAPQLRNEGTPIYSLLRNIGGSVGISIVQALLTRGAAQSHAVLSTFVAPVVFAVSVRPATGPSGAATVDVKPSGTPAVDAGLKYGLFNALSISPRNSKVKRPGSWNFFEMPRSRRVRLGAFTVTLRRPQSP